MVVSSLILTTVVWMSVTAPNVKLWKIFLQQHLVLHRFPDAAALVVLELFLGQLFLGHGLSDCFVLSKIVFF